MGNCFGGRSRLFEALALGLGVRAGLEQGLEGQWSQWYDATGNWCQAAEAGRWGGLKRLLCGFDDFLTKATMLMSVFPDAAVYFG